MAIDHHRLLARPFKDVVQQYDSKDTILYALGLGLGADPLDQDQLAFVYEDGLKALPSMAAVLAGPGFWLREPDTGVDWQQVLHGEEGIVLHRPLAATGTLVGRSRVAEVIDKGAGKGALIVTERNLHDAATGELVATVSHTSFARGDGGFGGPRRELPPPHALPRRQVDAVCDLPTLPQAALIYRLSGDFNPLHACPRIAAAAGFPRPILHGLCTLGVATHAIVKTLCGYAPERLRALQLRFSAPVFPGETIRTEMWQDGEVVSFRARVVERDVVVLNNGRAIVAT